MILDLGYGYVVDIGDPTQYIPGVGWVSEPARDDG